MASHGDVPIVRKLDERSDPAQHAMGLQPVQKREVVLRVQAESLDNMRKQATVCIAHPKGSTFQIICDEGSYLGGDDSAPPPLAYYSASIAFALRSAVCLVLALLKQPPAVDDCSNPSVSAQEDGQH